MLGIAYHAANVTQSITEQSFRPLYTDQFSSTWSAWDENGYLGAGAGQSHRCTEMLATRSRWSTVDCTDYHSYACAVTAFGE